MFWHSKYNNLFQHQGNFMPKSQKYISLFMNKKLPSVLKNPCFYNTWTSEPHKMIT